MEGLKVNFSGKEASSQPRTFEPVPTGKYHVKLTDGTWEECGPESKNPGKPYWALEFTIQDGPYEGQHLWSNVMLFEGALYSLAQLMKALGEDIEEGEFTLPELESLFGKDFIVGVKKQRDTYKEKKEGDGEIYWKNEIKSYFAFEAGATPAPTGKTGKASRLP
jgi:hypothetical protein